MKLHRNIIITISLLLTFALAGFAHGGFDHVQGTLVTVEKNILTVRTSKGDTKVKLDAKTEITRGDKPAVAADLLPGLRVVVDVAEGDKNMVAHSIKIGAAAAKAATKTK